MPIKSIMAIGGAAFILSACAPNTPREDTVELSNTDQFTRAETLSAACSGCHTPDSVSIPSLASLSAEQITVNMDRYKSEPDGTTVMHRLARGYSDADIALIAAYLTAQEGEE